MGEQTKSHLLIPRVFHRIWLGDKPLPDYAVEYGRGWLRHHPGWQMQLWTERNLPRLVNRRRFEQESALSFRSDLLRLEIIRLFGGVYLDTDFECQKSILPLLGGVEAFAAYTEPENFWFKAHFETAILGAVPHHPLFERAVLEHETWMQEHEGESLLVKASAWYVANKIEQEYGENVNAIQPGCENPLSLGNLILFPKSYFYPYHHSQMHLAHLDYPESYAIHRIKSSWQS